MNLFEEFLYNLQYARGKSTKTIAAYKPHLDEFKKYVFDDKEVITIEDIRGLQAEDLLTKWLRVKEKEGLKASSLNQRLATVKSLYKYLEGRREVQYNITVSISQFKDVEKFEKVILNLEESWQLLDVAQARVGNLKPYEGLRDLLIAVTPYKEIKLLSSFFAFNEKIFWLAYHSCFLICATIVPI